MKETDTPSRELADAVKTIQRLYSIDAGLVREGAKKHGVRVTTGNMTSPLSEGNYNARIPDGSSKEIAVLTKARKIAFICEDYRQSHHAARAFGADAVFASAGGVVQPDATRRSAMAHFAAEIYKINPSVKFIFAFHTEICGGANYFTGKRMEQIRASENGLEAEIKAMTEYAHQFIEDVMAAGVPEANFELHTVHLHEPHKHAGHGHHVRHIEHIHHKRG